MGFYTSLVYYRPRDPPLVTTENLAEFISRLSQTKAIHEDDSAGSVEVKFGNSINQDPNPTFWLEESGFSPQLSFPRSIEYDLVSGPRCGLSGIVETLKSTTGTIYRADVDLGRLSDDVLRDIERSPSVENEEPFLPQWVNFSIGPVDCGTYNEEGILVGWMELTLSGQGRLYPWSFRDIFTRLEASGEVQELMSICCDQWPVQSSEPEESVVSARRECQSIWPYDEFNRPWDWYWGIHES